MITHLFKDSTTGQLHGNSEHGSKTRGIKSTDRRPGKSGRGSDSPRGAHSPALSCQPGAQTERGVSACLSSQQNRKTVLTKDTFFRKKPDTEVGSYEL